MNNPNAHYARTTTETEAMQYVRFNHMRHIAAKFLNETKAANLERDLADLLVKIDEQHQEQMRVLNLRITEILSSR